MALRRDRVWALPSCWRHYWSRLISKNEVERDEGYCRDLVSAVWGTDRQGEGRVLQAVTVAPNPPLKIILRTWLPRFGWPVRMREAACIHDSGNDGCSIKRRRRHAIWCQLLQTSNGAMRVVAVCGLELNSESYANRFKHLIVYLADILQHQFK